ncbi:MAG: hypothetical protein JJW00_07580 [Sulfurimonas sp.]|nr:hypothetical protein [Sulfurimonas sp.]
MKKKLNQLTTNKTGLVISRKKATKTNIANIEKELIEVKSKMSGYLEELGL